MIRLELLGGDRAVRRNDIPMRDMSAKASPDQKFKRKSVDWEARSSLPKRDMGRSGHYGLLMLHCTRISTAAGGRSRTHYQGKAAAWLTCLWRRAGDLNSAEPAQE